MNAGPHDAFRPGDVLETVLVGYPVGGVVRLWHDERSPSTWRLEDSEVLTRHLALGELVRSEVISKRFREAGLFNPESHTLVLPRRHPDRDGNMEVAATVVLESIARDEADQAASESDLADFFERLGPIVVSAARRGEFVAIETGGWEIPFAPFVLFAVLRDPGHDWQSHVETSPVPRGAPVWSQQPQPDDDDGTQVLRAPASVENIVAGPTLAGIAIAGWNTSLLDWAFRSGRRRPDRGRASAFSASRLTPSSIRRPRQLARHEPLRTLRVLPP